LFFFALSHVSREQNAGNEYRFFIAAREELTLDIEAATLDDILRPID
jgi:hypothetical protein